MPFKWEKNKNPYTNNYFSRLKVGPNMNPGQISEYANILVQKINSGIVVEGPDKCSLDEHAIKDAETNLKNAKALSEELLLVHPQPEREKTNEIKNTVKLLREKATLPSNNAPMTLKNPTAIFWFITKPTQDIVDLPAWDELDIVGPNDQDDLLLDIVFDS